jgi:ribulose-phosphate 3-epimerase
MRIIPTVFATNKKDFLSRYKRLQSLHIPLHIDIMDGKFVKAKSQSVSSLPDLYKISAEAHLMVYKPGSYINKLKTKGIKKIIFHYEALKNIKKIQNTINIIHKKGMRAWLAINPETQIKKIYPFLSNTDGILFMGVRPGKEHQNFIKSVYSKINELREINSKIEIQVDGGVNKLVLRRLKHFNINAVNIGSRIASADNPKEAIKELQAAT